MASLEASRFSWLAYSEIQSVYDSDVGSEVKFFDQPELPEMEEQDGDVEYECQVGDRLDNLAFRFYGTVLRWSVIALRNGFDLPDEEVWPGRQIVIPDPEYVKELFQR